MALQSGKYPNIMLDNATVCGDKILLSTCMDQNYTFFTIFRYVRDRMQTGNVFGSKDLFSGLAIIADTYSNHNGPHNVSRCSKQLGSTHISNLVIFAACTFP